ncbi:MAG: multicopper oxidase family protein, partial [Limisphaerales bacterium]
MKFVISKQPSRPHFLNFFILTLLAWSSAEAKIVEYDLEIAEHKMAPAGKMVRVLAVNGTIPGPVLRFREGDIARVRVHNRLKKETTSVHWHGLLLPNREDGVPYLTTPPIFPGATHTFEFPLTHSGTYWYHSHTGLQEQRGVYGSIVVEPKDGEPLPADREHVVVLSDWTNENPDEVMRTLMRGSEYYAIRKGNAQSIVGAIRAGALRDYFDRERARMPAMDISDVAYDAFLINGKPRTTLEGRPGETIRLRVINAAASTYFYVQSATGPMTIVANDGPAVRPIKVNRLFIGVAETYDVLVTIPESGAWEFRATAQDGSGLASAFIGEGTERLAPDIPKPDLYRMDETLLAAIMDAERSANLTDEEALASELSRPISPYRRLRSPTSTRIDQPTNNVRTIPMRLTGDMERYIWSINGKTLKEDTTILIKQGEVLRLELINDTMMHHPMHLHGHFFRVLEGDDEYAPLKHTVDVPPMGRRTIEFLANEEGDWFFHCHILYHMEAGMGRVFSYSDSPNHKPDFGPVSLDPYYPMIEGSIQTHMTMGMATLMNSRNNFNLLWDVGIEHDTGDGDHKHHFEYEIDLTYSRYIDQNLSWFAGVR